MQVGTDRIREIVLSLRNFSRLDEAEFKAVDIHEGLDNTLVILRHRFKAKAERPEIQVMQDYGQLPLVECYAGQLNQVFMNILSNAIDALEEANQGRSFAALVAEPNILWIQTAVVGQDRVQITIADNGPGIAAAVLAHLFNPFFTTKAVGKGTGLGLSISYQIITEKHGGHLSCHSTPGQGAKFIIEIPIQQATPERSQRELSRSSAQ
jgi:signal transduction histidine kinase